LPEGIEGILWIVGSIFLIGASLWLAQYSSRPRSPDQLTKNEIQRVELEAIVDIPARTILYWITRFVDVPEVRLTLWILWAVAGLPLLLVSLMGIGYGLGTRLSTPFWLGAGGLLGIVGAAVRLATPAWNLQIHRTRWWIAAIGILMGSCVSLYPVANMLNGPSTYWNLPILVAPIMGVILLLATVGVRPTTASRPGSKLEPSESTAVDSIGKQNV
jgi:hypothetical protein